MPVNDAPIQETHPIVQSYPSAHTDTKFWGVCFIIYSSNYEGNNTD